MYTCYNSGLLSRIRENKTISKKELNEIKKSTNFERDLSILENKKAIRIDGEIITYLGECESEYI